MKRAILCLFFFNCSTILAHQHVSTKGVKSSLFNLIRQIMIDADESESKRFVNSLTYTDILPTNCEQISENKAYTILFTLITDAIDTLIGYGQIVEYSKEEVKERIKKLETIRKAIIGSTRWNATIKRLFYELVGKHKGELYIRSKQLNKAVRTEVCIMHSALVDYLDYSFSSHD